MVLPSETSALSFPQTSSLSTISPHLMPSPHPADIPIHPSLHHLFSMCWWGQFYFATQLALSCCSSPKIFSTLSEAQRWILLNNHRVPFLLHILDDFILISPPLDPPALSLFPLHLWCSCGDLSVLFGGASEVHFPTSDAWPCWALAPRGMFYTNQWGRKKKPFLTFSRFLSRVHTLLFTPVPVSSSSNPSLFFSLGA